MRSLIRSTFDQKCFQSSNLDLSSAHLTIRGQILKIRMNSTILLVDDNAIQAATRKAILERTGCQVILASDGESALETLSNSDFTSTHTVRLIVTDHLMPGMNGPELVREVRRRGFNVPILVLSGLPDAETEYEDMNVAFRLKPFAPDSLIALVQELLCSRMPRSA